jgi:hypothetical protein
MKYLLFFLSLGLLLSCGKDADNDFITLNYDGDNRTAPTLPAGFYEFAVRFPANVTRNVQGLNIEEVDFYLYDAPDNIAITISPDANGLPGEIAYSQGVGTLSLNGWNNVPMNTPFALNGDAIWVGIQVQSAQTKQTVGCDAGPANPNGDWLYDDADEEFRTFRDRVGDSVNWNIRVKVK